TMDDLDYMHARYYSPFLGRFGRVDPFRGSPTSPQSLNRYAYVLGNPINLMDPFGFGPNREEGDVETIRDAITVVASYYWYLTGLGGHHSPGRRMAEPHGPIFLGRIGTMARLLRSGPPAPEPDNPVTDEPGNSTSGGGSGQEEGSSEQGSEGGEGNARDDCTFSKAWRENFNQTTQFLPFWSGVPAGLLAAPRTAEIVGTATLQQWGGNVLGAIKKGGLSFAMKMGGVSFTGLETTVLMGLTSVTNSVWVTSAWGTGLVVGSAFDIEFDSNGGPYNTGWYYLELADCD
ncbi:MAG: RHS repeat-associated core domain-containing protein, partial [Thermoanaerobaculia bacterium]